LNPLKEAVSYQQKQSRVRLTHHDVARETRPILTANIFPAAGYSLIIL
jgi:FMN-dependent NADH-azoreductase